MTLPAPVTAPVTCHACPKAKEYSSNQGLKAHVKRKHQNTIDQVQNLATLLTPPAPVHLAHLAPPAAPAPDSPAPPAVVACGAATPTTGAAVKPVAGNAPDPTNPTPGGSGLVTPATTAPVPRTLSFAATSPTAKSTIEEELEAEMEVLEEAAKEEQELYEALEGLTEININPETESETRAFLKEKLERYRTIMTNKNKIIGSIQGKVKSLDLSCQTVKHDYKMSEEVVEEQKKKLEEAGNKLKKVESEHKKAKEQHNANIRNMQDTVGIVTQSNNDLKSEVEKLNGVIKALEEAIAPDDTEDDDTADTAGNDTVQGHHQEETARVDMSKGSTEHRCQACDKAFNKAADLDRHIKDKHTESECNMCDKRFTTRKQAGEHICLEGDLIPQTCEKSYCQKEFISTSALKEHMKTAHFGHQRSVCPKCGQIGNDKREFKKHIESCGKRLEEIREKSNEVCYHWRRGNCNRGSRCGFSHVGRQDTPRRENNSTRNTPPACKNGPSCTFLARGRCNFVHHEARHHQNWRQDSRRQHQNQNDGRPLCRDQGDCSKVPNCPNIHNSADFPQYTRTQGFRGTNKRGNNQFRS